MTTTRRRRRLPARIYWFRRALVVAVLVVVVMGVWWLASPEHSTAPSEASTPPVQPVASTPAVSHRTSVAPASATPSATRPVPSPVTSAAPATECTASLVSVSPQKAQGVPGRSLRLAMVLTDPHQAPCRLAVTPRVLSVQVASETGTVWSSTECPNQLPAREVVVTASGTTYHFTWDGRASSSGCATGGQVTPTGHFTLRAAFLGGPLGQATVTLGRSGH